MVQLRYISREIAEVASLTTTLVRDAGKLSQNI